jgi:NADH-quinone oxidoreductase subunit D
MPTVTREYEAPDVAAKAAMQVESMEATTTDLVGEKMVLNMVCYG